jgi:hypothetical protein
MFELKFYQVYSVVCKYYSFDTVHMWMHLCAYVHIS